MERPGPRGQYEAGAAMSRVAVGCMKGDLGNKNWCIRFLRDLCAYIGMTPCIHEHFELNNGALEKQGVSASLILMESHICVHTWTFYSAVRVELSSCKDFDPHDVEEFLRAYLDPTEIKPIKVV